MLKVRVPAGIGDISWPYSKLSDIGKELEVHVSCDAPNRSLPFVQLLPNVVNCCYDNLNFHQICNNNIPENTSIEKFYDDAEKDIVNFTLNNFLEAGNRIEKFMPDLPTNLHYNIKTTNADHQLGLSLKSRNCALIGIFTSGYQCIAHWSGWHLKEWSTFIKDLSKFFPKATFIFLGAPYDKPFVDDLYNILPDVPKINLCGKTSVGELVEVIKVLNYNICFPSGIGILSNVLRTPVFMQYPPHLKKLINAWPDLDSIENKEYKGALFCEPGKVFNWILNEYRLQDKIGG